jgi:hypothetical protein
MCSKQISFFTKLSEKWAIRCRFYLATLRPIITTMFAKNKRNVFFFFFFSLQTEMHYVFRHVDFVNPQDERFFKEIDARKQNPGFFFSFFFFIFVFHFRFSFSSRF